MKKELLVVGKPVTLTPKNKSFGVNKRESCIVTGILDTASLYGFEDKNDSIVFLSLSTITKYVNAAKGIEEKTSVALFYEFNLDEYEIRSASGIEAYTFAKHVWDAKDAISQTASNGNIFEKLKELHGFDIEELNNLGAIATDTDKADAEAMVKHEKEREANAKLLPAYNPDRAESLFKLRGQEKKKDSCLKLFLVSFFNHENVYVIDWTITGAWFQTYSLGEIKGIETVATTGESEWLPKLKGNLNGL